MASSNTMRVLRCVLLSVVIGCASARSIAAPQLADMDVRAALDGGRPQSVIVLLVEPVRAESDGPRRARRAAAKARVRAALDPASFEARYDYSELPMLALRLHHTEALSRLLAHSDVQAVYADRPIKAVVDASLTLVRQPPVASVMGRTGSGQTIAVVDTGVDYTQAALGSCSSPGVGVGCKVVASYYTATGTALPAPGDTLDSVGHGTEVSEVALSVAPGAGIAAVGVFDNGTATTADVVAGINWTIANAGTYNIAAVNLSLGDQMSHGSACTSSNSAFYTPVNAARNAGMVVVAAAGNDGFTSGIAAPACVAAVVATGAVYDSDWGPVGWSICSDSTTAADQVICFSDSGSLLDILAPGALFNFNGANYGGTSFASPMVAATVALLKAQFPGDSPTATESRILSSGVSLTDPRNGLVRPRLDVLAAQGPPVNDAFASRVGLSGNSVAASGWNFNATLEPGEPAVAGQSGGHSVWWSWTAGSNGGLTVDASASAIPTFLAAYSGSALGSLAEVATGSTSLSLGVTAGSTYSIQVDGQSGGQGAIGLALNWTPSSADLAVTLTGPAGPVRDGQSIDVTAIVTNAGPNNAASTALTFTLPAGWQYLSGPTGCSSSGQSVACELGTLAVGATRVDVVVEVGGTTPAQTVTAVVSSALVDSNNANNSAMLQEQVLNSVNVPLPDWALWTLGGMLLVPMLRRRS